MSSSLRINNIVRGIHVRKRGIPVRDSKNYKDWLISAEEDLLSAGC